MTGAITAIVAAVILIVAAGLIHRYLSKRRARVSAEGVTVEEAAKKERELSDIIRATSTQLAVRLWAAIGGRKVGEEELEKLSEVLYLADVGTSATDYLTEWCRENVSKNSTINGEELYRLIKQKIKQILSVDENSEKVLQHDKPHVIMVTGVNGVGKTTTIAKLANRYMLEGKKVLLAAADTYRAAAMEQISIWGDRCGCQVVRGVRGQDAAAVAFDAVSAARARDLDVVIADTAGRMHTRGDLMDELKKVKRVMGKAMEGAPHEIILVIDATTGQNAISQARMFHDALQLTGIRVAKMDGTAKGGVIIGICKELKLPVKYIGVGEGLEDLRRFEPSEFTEALFQ